MKKIPCFAEKLVIGFSILRPQIFKVKMNIIETISFCILETIVIPIAGQFYDVKRGDTLTSIARQFNTTAAELARVNRIQLNTVLQIGFRLYIPPAPKRGRRFSGRLLEIFADLISSGLQISI